MPTPELRDDEVLVQVHAAGVNQLASKIRDGEFKLILPYRLPAGPKADLAQSTAFFMERMFCSLPRPAPLPVLTETPPLPALAFPRRVGRGVRLACDRSLLQLAALKF